MFGTETFSFSGPLLTMNSIKISSEILVSGEGFCSKIVPAGIELALYIIGSFMEISCLRPEVKREAKCC